MPRNKQHHCSTPRCGNFAPARRWVGFGKYITVKPVCSLCAAFARTTAMLRRETGLHA